MRIASTRTKRRLNLQNARAHLVDQIEEHFVLTERSKRRHQKLRIKRDGKFPALVNDSK